ncbi:uncharacterized protein LOC100835098 [Brachypodium distachyon]|uniref:uncharacterized protein LOC100835098 n=1 Tax=Brachypodium distachyon TaxID=15368 RepID=UPI0001C71EC6|nr:uncharacterized protein LOC100835098 [Brachypodium distachyon]|eukprot:XP_003568114.1 uncharacterized protein LOC100835098 [Brachypodium distachyon]
MANHELVLGHGQDAAELALGQNHHDFGQDHHGLVLGHSHDLGLGHPQDHDFVLSHDHGHEHDHALVLRHHHHHDSQLVLGHDHTGDLALGQGHDEDSLDGEGHHDLGLSENHELALAEPHPLVDDDNLDHHFTLEQAHELALEPAHDFSQGPLAVAPVVQSRMMVVSTEFQLAVGQEFPDVMSCRRAIRDTAIACHFEIQTVKSDKTRFTAKCAAEGCPWRIHAAKLPGVPTFSIRTILDNHSCVGINHLGHQQASVQWVASTVEERLRENPHCKPKEILEEIHKSHGITLSYKQAWRGKERIMATVRGSFEEGYRLLPEYCRQIERTNPGSIARIYGNPDDNCFRRLFISFYASIYGFVNACRPLIGLDKTTLKNKYLGTLFLATAFDGDGALFPLAFGVVDDENDENWIWFLSELHELLEKNTENMPRLTILSDRRKGIVDGVDINFPTAFHGYCMRHLSETFRKEFNNSVLVNLLWEAASVLTATDFETKLLEIEDTSQEAVAWIREIPPRLWATAFFDGPRYGQLTANITESLNSWILDASSLPINQMMECLRRQLMTWFNERREASMQWTTILVPTAERRVQEAIERAQNYRVARASEAEFEVISPHEGTNVVDIRNRVCLCRGWQLYGMPCAHGVAALLSCRQNVHRYTESFFTIAMYRKTYSQTIHPIPDKTHWNETPEDQGEAEQGRLEVIINPPKSLRPPGRPRKKRVRAEDLGRVKRVVHCSRCNQTGHFRTTCVAPI